MKSYQQHCGLARALDVIGERWTLLMIREMLLGPRRFRDFSAKLEGMTTNLLAQRLKNLCELGLVEKREREYRLTSRGAALEPSLMALAEWGQGYMDSPGAGDRVDSGWALLSLKRRYKGELGVTVEVRVGERVFGLKFGEGSYKILEATPESPELLVSLSQEDFFAVFFKGAESKESHFLGGDKLIREFKKAFALT